MRAVKKGDREEVVRLLRSGADPRRSDSYGRNALTLAVHEKAGAEVISAICTEAKGVDLINLPDLWNNTPLETALIENPSCALLLLEHGADINAPDGKNRTALMLAARMNNFNQVAWLTAQGANHLAVVPGYGTPLGFFIEEARDADLAAARGGILRYLLEQLPGGVTSFCERIKKQREAGDEPSGFKVLSNVLATLDGLEKKFGNEEYMNCRTACLWNASAILDAVDLLELIKYPANWEGPAAEDLHKAVSMRLEEDFERMLKSVKSPFNLWNGASKALDLFLGAATQKGQPAMMDFATQCMPKLARSFCSISNASNSANFLRTITGSRDGMANHYEGILVLLERLPAEWDKILTLFPEKHKEKIAEVRAELSSTLQSLKRLQSSGMFPDNKLDECEAVILATASQYLGADELAEIQKRGRQT
jgi:hypothetical protein